MTIKFIDLFAGIGGMRMGFENADYQCVFSCEKDKFCKEVYEENFDEIPFGDITKLDETTIPPFDILIGGFPCQPFSISGKGKGFEDTRGTLFFDICRIIEHNKPSVVLLENVKQLKYHDKGNTLSVILNSLEKLGYKVSHEVLNAKDFGLPQNRERVIIVASKSEEFDFHKLQKTPSKELQEFLDIQGEFDFLSSNEYTLIDNPKKQKSGLIFSGYRNKNIRKKGVQNSHINLSRVHKQPNRIYSVEGVHPTLSSQETSGRFFVFLPKENKVRKLTITECYRIMGFPENFKRHKNLSEQYKQIGNSVCVPMIYEIAKELKNQGLIPNSENTLEDW